MHLSPPRSVGSIAARSPACVSSAIGSSRGRSSLGRSQGTRRGFLAGWLVVATFVGQSGCVSSQYLKVREKPHNSLASSLNLFSSQGPRPTPRTEQLLRRYDIAKPEQTNSPIALVGLEERIAEDPSPEKIYSYAELAYVNGTKALAAGQESVATDLFGAAVAHAYLYLFAPNLDASRNTYDPQFRQACDLYNNALESSLRILKKRGKLSPGQNQTIRTARHQLDISIEVRGPWRPEEFERVEFVSDFEVEGLANKYHTYGLGVPLIAVRKAQPQGGPVERYYPQGLTFPVTAFLRVHRPSNEVAATGGVDSQMRCVLELHDPLYSHHLEVCGRSVPLETDLSTPLGYFLDSPNFKASKIATLGLLRPSQAQTLAGVYMVEPYNPNKIPVLMVHGVWSSPMTWMEMFNDLRALPEIRERCQFWFYSYPTGQPFWISAAQLRDDLDQLKRTLDPQNRSYALNQMVLVGHSMGGLVSKLQTLDSRDDYWRIVSDKPFESLKADDETRAKLKRILFFQPNPGVRRVVTIGTPHRGSKISNDATQWLGHSLIALPAKMVQTSQRLIRENPGFFRDTDLLTITTSIDSLAKGSPILPVMLRSPTAPWTKYHNIVGLLPKDDVWSYVYGAGDRVVTFQSAHLDDVDSELVVEADHASVHHHPRSVLEVRRILQEHLLELQNAAQTAVGLEPRPLPGQTPSWSTGQAPPSIGPTNGPAPAASGQLRHDVQPVGFHATSTAHGPQVQTPAFGSPPVAHAAQPSPAGAAACGCECCRPKELPRFDYSALLRDPPAAE